MAVRGKFNELPQELGDMITDYVDKQDDLRALRLVNQLLYNAAGWRYAKKSYETATVMTNCHSVSTLASIVQQPNPFKGLIRKVVILTDELNGKCISADDCFTKDAAPVAAHGPESADQAFSRAVAQAYEERCLVDGMVLAQFFYDLDLSIEQAYTVEIRHFQWEDMSDSSRNTYERSFHAVAPVGLAKMREAYNLDPVAPLWIKSPPTFNKVAEKTMMALSQHVTKMQGLQGLILSRKHWKHNANLPITAKWLRFVQVDECKQVVRELEHLSLYITPSASDLCALLIEAAYITERLDFGYYRGYEFDDITPCRKFSRKSFEVGTNAVQSAPGVENFSEQGNPL
jgi:hypothetical protein